MSVSNYFEPVLLDTLDGYTTYAQLHIGDPGEACTSNVATETTRKLVTFAAASGGSKASSNAQSWTSYPAEETVTHVSIWDAATSGNALWYGSLSTSISLRVGNSLTFNTGSLVVTLD